MCEVTIKKVTANDLIHFDLVVSLTAEANNPIIQEFPNVPEKDFIKLIAEILNIELTPRPK